jgi:error-prone DNA polymerase
MDGFRRDWAERIVAARAAGGRFADMEDVARRAAVPQAALKRLADADAFGSLGLDRREALWAARRTPDGELPLFVAAAARELGAEPDMALPAMAAAEQVAVDYQTLRLSLKGHPMAHLRALLVPDRVLDCAGVSAARNGRIVRTAGIVLVRQRPGKGNAIFISIEDETGVTNIVLWARLFERYRREVMAARLLLVEGEVQRSPEGIVHLMARRVEDRSHLLARLTDGGTPIALSRADEFLHPQHPRGAAKSASHPRNVRILPKSRDFH